MEKIDLDNSILDKLVSTYLTLAFLVAIPLSILFTGDELFTPFVSLITSPCPLVTDYFSSFSLPATFLNAFLCSLSCTLLLWLLGASGTIYTVAGFFLVVAHSFYGLNALNMWPPMLGILAFCRVHGIPFRDNLSTAFYATAFGPFFSELLFRYPFTHNLTLPVGAASLSLPGAAVSVILSLAIGYAVPALLPGARKLHREMCLYNGGLAFGLLGLLFFSILYPTMGKTPPSLPLPASAIKGGFVFSNIFFLALFSLSFILGWIMNGGSMERLGTLMRDPGYKTDFLEKYGDGVTLMNLGLYGTMMVLYFDLVILLFPGEGWTGATFGIVLASVTFASSGQHPGNVWPVMAGYCLLSAIVLLLSFFSGTPVPWTLSSQAYMNGLAFATGLAPFTGRYGWKGGLAAGFVSAVICTTTVRMHGGFMLYNGGLGAGMAALIVTPLFDYYTRGKENRESIEAEAE